MARHDSIPDGYELLAGRNRENANKALATAEERGLDASLVRTHPDGYLIPLGEDSAPREGAPTEEWKVAEIDKWAEDNGVDLGDATKKADKIAAIQKNAARKEGE